ERRDRARRHQGRPPMAFIVPHPRRALGIRALTDRIRQDLDAMMGLVVRVTGTARLQRAASDIAIALTDIRMLASAALPSLAIVTELERRLAVLHDQLSAERASGGGDGYAR